MFSARYSKPLAYIFSDLEKLLFILLIHLIIKSSLHSDYHGINGNVSLDRRSEVVQSPNRYDLTLGSDKSTASHEGKPTSYDVAEAERNNQQNIINNNHTALASPTSNGSTQTNGNNHSTLERNGETHKRKWPADRAYFLTKEILMTERTYKRDLDVINTVSVFKLNSNFVNRFHLTIFCLFVTAIPQSSRA